MSLQVGRRAWPVKAQGSRQERIMKRASLREAEIAAQRCMISRSSGTGRLQYVLKKVFQKGSDLGQRLQQHPAPRLLPAGLSSHARGSCLGYQYVGSCAHVQNYLLSRCDLSLRLSAGLCRRRRRPSCRRFSFPWLVGAHHSRRHLLLPHLHPHDGPHRTTAGKIWNIDGTAFAANFCRMILFISVQC